MCVEFFHVGQSTTVPLWINTRHFYPSNVGKIIIYVSVIFDNNFPIMVIRISIFQQEFLVHNQGRRTRGGGSNG